MRIEEKSLEKFLKEKSRATCKMARVVTHKLRYSYFTSIFNSMLVTHVHTPTFESICRVLAKLKNYKKLQNR